MPSGIDIFFDLWYSILLINKKFLPGVRGGSFFKKRPPEKHEQEVFLL